MYSSSEQSLSSTEEQPFAQQHLFLNSNTQYRGRFAPSPSGPLHFGSLVAALGSYLQAKKHNGLWFVRIEDIDKPREQKGAVEAILNGLQAFGMQWDTDQLTNTTYTNSNCLIQSQRIERYEQILTYLINLNRVYACQCTRKQIKQSNGLYLGTCRELNLPLQQHALRLHLPELTSQFEDLLHGQIRSPEPFNSEDYIIKRKDGLFAYQLVVIVDDIDQGITEVVRGADIMPLTCRQLSLYQLFNVPSPRYLHLPLVTTQPGVKLSKQNHAKAIDIENPKPELLSALTFLGLPVVHQALINKSVKQIIDWAIENWKISHIPKQQEKII